MTPDQVKRKLAAILSADVKGYSRLMGEDEEWTLRTLNNHKEMMGSLIQQHRGRVVGTAGDNVLAEFASVVDAVQCGVEIQQMLRAKNAMLPDTRRMEFRIGINLGDVIEEGDSIYGDGVNIAARLESMAEAGGICISGSAFEQIENKLPLKYEYLGEHQVKNIAKPVRVYKAQIEPEAAPKQVPIGKKLGRSWLFRGAMIGAILVVIVGAITLYQFVLRPSSTKTEVASIEKMAYPLPDKPSIAVLPFVNMSGDPKQEFFSDGLTEDLITVLSKIPTLFVIARNSTFVYKGKSIKVKQVSEELGVRYVLEGSVQRSGNRVRITAQLIDALNGHHLWSERYDRDLKDLFALQDEITLRIIATLQMKLTEGEVSTLENFFKGKPSIECYLRISEAVYYLTVMSVEGNNRARRIAEEIITKWPENPTGYLLSGVSHFMDLLFGSTKSPEESLRKAMELAKKSLSMDETNPYAYSFLSIIYCYLKEYDKAIAEGKKAVSLNPGGASTNEKYAESLYYAGRYEEAIPIFKKAIRLNPLGSTNAFNCLGVAYWATGRTEEAFSTYKQALWLSPDNLFAHINMAFAYLERGKEKEARAEAAEVLRINPNFSLGTYAKGMYSLFKDQAIIKKYIDNLRKAGLK